MITRFEWNPKRTAAALALAQGHARERVASALGVTRKTIYNWLCVPEFAAEVDRLSSMVGIAGRAERLRITMRVVRRKVRDETVETDRDLLDWLKFAQSETQGVKLDLAKLAAACAQ
jgi:transposase-like protein